MNDKAGAVLYLPLVTRERLADEEAALTKALPADLRPLFLDSVHTSLRWSEQSALRWQDVDVLSATLTVGRSRTGIRGLSR